MIKIAYLADYPDFTEIVTEWLFNEFFVDIRPGVTYEQLLEAIKNTNKTKLPIRLIALSDDKCIGTISIVSNDLRSRSYTPWLASLYVDPPYRKNKIGAQLVERVKQIVKELGYSELYLRTEFASDYYRARNWQYVETCTDDEFLLEPDVFRISL